MVAKCQGTDARTASRTIWIAHMSRRLRWVINFLIHLQTPSLSTPVKWTRYVCATCQYSFRHCYSPMPIVACFRHTLRMNLPIRTSGEMEFVSIAILSATVRTDSRAVVATLYAANPISFLSTRPCPLTLNRCADASLRRNVVHLKGTYRLCRSCCQPESGR